MRDASCQGPILLRSQLCFKKLSIQNSYFRAGKLSLLSIATVFSNLMEVQLVARKIDPGAADVPSILH